MRTNELGNQIIGEHPDCVCDGDMITVWDCDCPECQDVRSNDNE